MSDMEYDRWLEEVLPKYRRLTESVVIIIENLLRAGGIDYLAVTGRTKDKKGALEKIKRKGYRDPKIDLTDLSGIRVILYFESDIERASQVIHDSFTVDDDNSLNQDDLMSTDQIGYRSVHFVCDIGKDRSKLPEFSDLAGLKFEFQVRTVLQHAWAELAHDRNYKFSGKLPKKLERQLYLYAGMLEIADRGFDEVSKQIDDYVAKIYQKSDLGDLNIDIDSISIASFVKSWAEKRGLNVEIKESADSDLIQELDQFGIKTLGDLDSIIPENYADAMIQEGEYRNMLGVVRDWMLIHDWRRFAKTVEYNWVVEEDDSIFKHYFSKEEMYEFLEVFGLYRAQL